MITLQEVQSRTEEAFHALSPSLKELEEFEERGRRILESFQSEDIPVDLFRFSDDDFPIEIRSDRDIFLARVRRKDFGYFDNLRYRIEDLIPWALHGDKEVMLECVQRNPRSVECLSDELKNDKDLFRAVLKASPLPPKFLLPFSEAVRSDPDLIMELFNHPDVSPTDVKPKTQVMRYASKRLQEDYDFVLQCVQKSGLNLRHASPYLRRDPIIVAAACAECSEAISYSLPEAIDAGIFEHKAIAKSVVPQADLGLVLQCLKRYNYDPEVVTMAMRNNDFDWELMVPEARRCSIDFIVETLRLLPVKVWYTLPDDIQSDFRVASEIFNHKISAEMMIWEAIDQCPDVLFSRDCIKAFLLNHSHLSSVLEHISGITDVDIWNDRELMMAAISQNNWNWDYCSEELRHDKAFMIEVAENFPSVFVCIEDEYQMEHPEMVIRAMQKHPDHLRERFDDFCPELWENRDVAMAWLQIGGGWSRHFFPQAFQDDEEMILLATRQHCEDFAVASENLLQDITFVSKALALNPAILEYVDPDIIHEEEILLAAVSSDSHSIDFFMEVFEDHGTLVSFAQTVRRRLREYWGFHQVFTPATSPSSDEKTECNLPMLNQGPTTLATYIDKIASYLGVLHQDDEIATYIAASNHLAVWGL